MPPRYISTKKAAEIIAHLGGASMVSPTQLSDALAAAGIPRTARRIRSDCELGLIDGATHVGRPWIIPTASIEAYLPYAMRSQGRPKKS